ncbi:MAG: RagB/SusD family nutrient uptake outer membrane protein [Candidatus Symbiothrix sp.]|jgi:hypothetical protein|nr:RagB/SusD family nutrient uptake outer membrane protein [Candidatus Symbiothrix sp.]
MKPNRIFIIFITGLLGFTTSCTDVSPEIYTDVELVDYYKTESQFASLIANAYSQLAGEYGYVYREGYWSLQEYTSDEVVVPTRGTDWFDNGVPQKMHTHTWEVDTRDINNGWSFAYGGSSKCNDVLAKIRDLKGTDESQYDDITKAGIAEAKVLRAFYHLLAMDVYGNATIDDGEQEIKQHSRTEIFNWIEKEIKDNLPNLNRKVRYGSVSAPVAHTILAKLYLNAEVYTGAARWQDAANECDSVIDGGYGYGLNDNYFTAFKKENTDNKEIIFAIVFDEKYAKGNMFHVMTLHYTQQEVYGFTTPTWNGPCTLKSFYEKYSDVDLRKTQWFVGPIQKDGKTLKYSNAALTDVDAIIVPEVTTIEDPTAANTFEGARFVKFEVEPRIEHHANSDFPIYRYADILLMKAEALMRLNGGVANTEALNLVNQVHSGSRTGLPPYSAAELTLPELLIERGRELAWEGHRRQDQIRFGTFTSGGWEFMSPGESPNRTIFPIPQWVMDANPGVYTQNNWQ